MIIQNYRNSYINSNESNINSLNSNNNSSNINNTQETININDNYNINRIRELIDTVNSDNMIINEFPNSEDDNDNDSDNENDNIINSNNLATTVHLNELSNNNIPTYNIYQNNNNNTINDTTDMSYENLSNLSNVPRSGVSANNLNSCTKLFVNELRYDMCIVCQCSFELNDIIRSLPCGHQFHQNCIDRWFLENNTCPLCVSIIE